MKEKQIENLILQWLELFKVLVFKVELQGTYDPTKRVYRTNKKRRTGISDLCGIHAKRFLAIEVKTEKGMQDLKRAIKRNRKGLLLNSTYKHLIEQYEFIKDVKRRGGIAFFTCSLDHTRKTLDKYKAVK